MRFLNFLVRKDLLVESFEEWRVWISQEAVFNVNPFWNIRILIKCSPYYHQKVSQLTTIQSSSPEIKDALFRRRTSHVLSGVDQWIPKPWVTSWFPHLSDLRCSSNCKKGVIFSLCNLQLERWIVATSSSAWKPDPKGRVLGGILQTGRIWGENHIIF